MASPESPQIKKPPVEVERKFFVKTLPENLSDYQHEIIRQGYLVIEDDGSEARVRNRAGSYTLTVKSKGDLSRGEWEVPLTPEQFTVLWPATAGKRVEKTRYSLPFENAVIELDIYEGELAGLVSAEVEFPDEESAYAFQPPEWFGVDVTSDKAFKNQQLALNGIPKLSEDS